MKTRFNKVQIVTICAIVGAMLFNPASVEILDEYFKHFYTIVWLGCTAWVVIYLLKKVLTPEKVNIPSKSKKSKVKTKEYLEA